MNFVLLFNLLYAFSRGADRAKKTIIITRSGCQFSENMRVFLRSKNIPFVDLNESILDADIMSITSFPGHTYPSVFVNGKHIGGYDESKNNPIFLGSELKGDLKNKPHESSLNDENLLRETFYGF